MGCASCTAGSSTSPGPCKQLREGYLCALGNQCASFSCLFLYTPPAPLVPPRCFCSQISRPNGGATHSGSALPSHHVGSASNPERPPQMVSQCPSELGLKAQILPRNESAYPSLPQQCCRQMLQLAACTVGSQVKRGPEETSGPI